jgi:hypothetical protein
MRVQTEGCTDLRILLLLLTAFAVAIAIAICSKVMRELVPKMHVCLWKLQALYQSRQCVSITITQFNNTRR